MQISKLLTQTHHTFVSQFIDCKESNDQLVKENAVLLNAWKSTEIAMAHLTPIGEAKYALLE